MPAGAAAGGADLLSCTGKISAACLRGAEPRIGRAKIAMARAYDAETPRLAAAGAHAGMSGPVTFAQLIARFGSAAAALEELPRLAGAAAARISLPPRRRHARARSRRWRKSGGRLIAVLRAGFSRRPGRARSAAAADIRAGPRASAARATWSPSSARATPRRWRANSPQLLARDLGEAGLVVVSGLARGIDTAAHEAALAAGTIAVVAGGVDVIYPPENETLYRAIVEQGAIISEMPFGEAPQARHFPRRNRFDLRPLARRGGGGSRRTIRLADHRQLCAGTGPRDFRRARFAARSPRQGRQPPDPRRRHPDRKRGRCAVGAGAPSWGGKFREPEPEPPAAPQIELGLEQEADHVRRRVEEALGPAPVEMDELIRQTGAEPAAGADRDSGAGIGRKAPPPPRQSGELGCLSCCLKEKFLGLLFRAVFGLTSKPHFSALSAGKAVLASAPKGHNLRARERPVLGTFSTLSYTAAGDPTLTGSTPFHQCPAEFFKKRRNSAVPCLVIQLGDPR